MLQADFSSWSIYTGPSNLKTIINGPNCPWVVGNWNGINANTSKEELKKDIDYRIDIIIKAFNKMLSSFKTYNRHFVIPEFFFHCTQGPYPNIKIDDKNYPFEYIVTTLKSKIEEAIPKDNNYYTVVIGSALTSNIEDYTTFLASNEVIERQNQLNEALSNGLLSNFKTHNFRTWKRELLNNKHTSSSLKAFYANR